MSARSPVVLRPTWSAWAARENPRRSRIGFLDAWFDTLGLTKNVTLVLHDWGSALGFHRAARFPKQVKAIAYMEAIALPRRWEDFGEAAAIFRALRSDQGERMILDENFFVETILRRSVIRSLSDEEMAVYRAPYLEREARLPTLTWPRQIPIEGEPADVTAIVQAYGMWLSQSMIPKLLIVGDSGAIICISAAIRARLSCSRNTRSTSSGSCARHCISFCNWSAPQTMITTSLGGSLRAMATSPASRSGP